MQRSQIIYTSYRV